MGLLILWFINDRESDVNIGHQTVLFSGLLKSDIMGISFVSRLKSDEAVGSGSQNSYHKSFLNFLILGPASFMIPAIV